MFDYHPAMLQPLLACAVETELIRERSSDERKHNATAPTLEDIPAAQILQSRKAGRAVAEEGTGGTAAATKPATSVCKRSLFASRRMTKKVAP